MVHSIPRLSHQKKPVMSSRKTPLFRGWTAWRLQGFPFKGARKIPTPKDNPLFYPNKQVMFPFMAHLGDVTTL